MAARPARTGDRNRSESRSSRRSDAELVERARQVQGAFELRDGSLSAGSVGAALRTRSGQVFTGVCLDLSCGIGFCAEHAAIAEMLKHQEAVIEAIVAVGERGAVPPCGRCRELMIQISPENAKTRVILGPHPMLPLAKLLPHHWL